MQKIKIKIWVILFIYILSPLIVFSQNLDYKKAIVHKAAKLKEIYDSYKTSGNNPKFEQMFFDEFPKTFVEFNSLYGAKGDSLSILYNEALTHLRFFNKIKSVKDTIYYSKIVSIAIGGHWDSDGVTYFQDGLRNSVLKNVDLTIAVLKRKKKNEIHDFWIFYFDEPHPKSTIDNRLNSIKARAPEIYGQLLKAKKEVVEDWKKNS